MQTKFKSDGCTGFFDGNHRHCCVQHDLDDFNKLADSTADLSLFDCVSVESGVALAVLMYIGVKLGRPVWRLYKRYR